MLEVPGVLPPGGHMLPRPRLSYQCYCRPHPVPWKLPGGVAPDRLSFTAEGGCPRDWAPQRAKEASEAPHQKLTKDTTLFRLSQEAGFGMGRGNGLRKVMQTLL